MTRKRFIKMLMSKGVQRNQAAQIAKEVREYGVVGLSYKAASNIYPLVLNSREDRKPYDYWIRSPDPLWFPGKLYFTRFGITV